MDRKTPNFVGLKFSQLFLTVIEFGSAISNIDAVWKHHISDFIGPSTLQSAPVPVADMEGETMVKMGNSVIRSSQWKLRYAEIRSSMYPESITAEKTSRQLRRKAISLALRSLPDGSIQKASRGARLSSVAPKSEEEDRKEAKEEELLRKYLDRVQYVPVRVVLLGDEGIGKSETCMKYVESHMTEGPLGNIQRECLQPYRDRNGSYVFTKCEKGKGKFDFRVTIVEPPSDNKTVQIASLRGVDAVMIGFAVNNEASMLSVVNHWIPLVRQWLGPDVPISALGFKYDTLVGASLTNAIQEISTSSETRALEICVPPYKRSFWRAWKPDDCPLPNGEWSK